MAIEQKIDFEVSAETIYAALLSSEVFAAATGADATIAPEVGGEFSCFGGQITGRHLELLSNERIVQAWRASPWPDGLYSIVRFELEQIDDKTQLKMIQAAYPDGSEGHLEGGWKKMYWDPLKAHFASA